MCLTSPWQIIRGLLKYWPKTCTQKEVRNPVLPIAMLIKVPVSPNIWRAADGILLTTTRSPFWYCGVKLWSCEAGGPRGTLQIIILFCLIILMGFIVMKAKCVCVCVFRWCSSERSRRSWTWSSRLSSSASRSRCSNRLPLASRALTSRYTGPDRVSIVVQRNCFLNWFTVLHWTV